jgi:hypothetical protein
VTDLATAVTGWAEDRPDVIGTMFARGFRVLSDRAGIAVWATVDLFERVERELGRPPSPTPRSASTCVRC